MEKDDDYVIRRLNGIKLEDQMAYSQYMVSPNSAGQSASINQNEHDETLSQIGKLQHSRETFTRKYVREEDNLWKVLE